MHAAHAAVHGHALGIEVQVGKRLRPLPGLLDARSEKRNDVGVLDKLRMNSERFPARGSDAEDVRR